MSNGRRRLIWGVGTRKGMANIGQSRWWEGLLSERMGFARRRPWRWDAYLAGLSGFSVPCAWAQWHGSQVITEKGRRGLPKGYLSSSQAWHPRRCHAEPVYRATAYARSRPSCCEGQLAGLKAIPVAPFPTLRSGSRDSGATAGRYSQRKVGEGCGKGRQVSAGVTP